MYLQKHSRSCQELITYVNCNIPANEPRTRQEQPLQDPCADPTCVIFTSKLGGCILLLDITVWLLESCLILTMTSTLNKDCSKHFIGESRGPRPCRHRLPTPLTNPFPAPECVKKPHLVISFISTLVRLLDGIGIAQPLAIAVGYASGGGGGGDYGITQGGRVSVRL